MRYSDLELFIPMKSKKRRTIYFMATIRELLTEADFQEAEDRKLPIRVFRDDHLIDALTYIVRFTDTMIITQSDVSDMTYHSRRECQFYELKK